MYPKQEINDAGKIFLEAAQNGNLFLIDALLKPLSSEQTIDSIADDEYGGNALHWAVFNGHLAITKRLVQQFPLLLNSITKNGSTPLLNAITTEQTEIFKYLMQQGANPAIKNNKHEDAFILANKLSQQHPIKKDLEEYRQLVNKNYRTAVREDDKDAQIEWLYKGADATPTAMRNQIKFGTNQNTLQKDDAASIFNRFFAPAWMKSTQINHSKLTNNKSVNENPISNQNKEPSTIAIEFFQGKIAALQSHIQRIEASQSCLVAFNDRCGPARKDMQIDTEDFTRYLGDIKSEVNQLEKYFSTANLDELNTLIKQNFKLEIIATKIANRTTNETHIIRTKMIPDQTYGKEYFALTDAMQKVITIANKLGKKINKINKGDIKLIESGLADQQPERKYKI